LFKSFGLWDVATVLELWGVETIYCKMIFFKSFGQQMASQSQRDSDQQAQEDHGLTGETQGDQAFVDQPLFFIDSSGGKEDDEETEV
jgi:hypothetical protein